MLKALSNSRHEHFAHLTAAGETPTKAYILVGYSEKGAAASANRLLKNAKISIRIKELQEAVGLRAIEKAALDRAWVLARLRENVERSMAAVPVLDRDGNRIGEFTYQGNVANRSLELIGKELGMFVDSKKVSHVDEHNPANMSDSQLAESILRAAEALKTGVMIPTNGNGHNGMSGCGQPGLPQSGCAARQDA